MTTALPSYTTSRDVTVGGCPAQVDNSSVQIERLELAAVLPQGKPPKLEIIFEVCDR
jgi:hypothetical protein